MKRLKIAMMALVALVAVGNLNAQDENNPWVVGFGINNVDYTDGPVQTANWNVLTAISRISAEKYLEKGFTLQLAGSLNEITNDGIGDSDFLYYSIGAAVKYDLNNLVGETSQWFDPYVYLGGDYVSADSFNEGMLNTGVGFNTWFNDNLGLNFQVGRKIGFSDKENDHYQSSIGLAIKFGGYDTDGDGVYDKKDACPEVVGLVEFNGCPDADGDGIKDSDDACPNVAGLAAMNGCPDADGDGLADKDDMCPNSKGTKANKGCPDSDGDSVVDKDDKCATLAGPAANNGCPWPDTDGDGVLDKDDKCPSVAGVASEGGCPEPVISEAAKMGLDTFAKAILFNIDKSSFKSGVTNQLGGMLIILNEFPKSEFAVKGFTDNTGSPSGNLKLSDKRANAVRDYLISKGIDASRLTAKGYGEDSPIDSNKTRSGRSNNRRVEVKVTN